MGQYSIGADSHSTKLDQGVGLQEAMLPESRTAKACDASQSVLRAEDGKEGAGTSRHIVQFSEHRAEWLPDSPPATDFAGFFKPGIAIPDISMPVMDGYRAARLLRLEQRQVLLMPGAAELGHAGTSCSRVPQAG